ncbi:peptidase, M16 family, partial [Cooperia oncophora]
FIVENGGKYNARTGLDHTSYYFCIKPNELKGALDRFAQFFLAPKFTKNATEREVRAVDSEHSQNLKNDSKRILQVIKYLSKPGHDYGKFLTGNKVGRKFK